MRTTHHCSQCPEHQRCPVPEACWHSLEDEGGVEMLGGLLLTAVAVAIGAALFFVF